MSSRSRALPDSRQGYSLRVGGVSAVVLAGAHVRWRQGAAADHGQQHLAQAQSLAVAVAVHNQEVRGLVPRRGEER